MVISDENETEGCHYAEVSGLDTKKRQPEKVTVACPVFPLPHDRFTALSALAAAADGKAGGMADPDEGTCAMGDACGHWLHRIAGSARFFAGRTAVTADRYQSAAVAGRAAQLYWRGEASALSSASDRGHRQCKYASCPTTERFPAVHGHSDAVSVQYAFVVIHCDIWFCSSSPSLIEGKSRRVTGGFIVLFIEI